jgi:hypothetical protein
MFQYIYNYVLDSKKEEEPIFKTIKERIAVSKIENFYLKYKSNRRLENYTNLSIKNIMKSFI